MYWSVETANNYRQTEENCVGLAPSLAKPRANSRKLMLQRLDNPLGTSSPARRCLSTTVRKVNRNH